MTTKEKNFPFLAPMVVIIVLAILGMAVFFTYQKSKELSGSQNNPNQNQQTACTTEAKICPDGVTAVGRMGPNCDFAPCPQDKTASWKVYTNQEYGFKFKYPEKLESKFFNLKEPIIIKSSKTDKNIKDGCFIGGLNPAQKRQDLKVLDVNFCLSQSYDAGAGSGANYYFYTFLNKDYYYTIQFQINQPNSCSPYVGTENQGPCQADFQNYQTIVDKPTLESINTLKFLN